MNMYASGQSSVAIAAVAGVSHNAVLNRLRRAGIKSRTGAAPRKYNYDQMVEDYKSGMSFTEVAKKHGSDVQSARRVIILSGVVLRDSNHSRPRGERHPWWRGGKRKSNGYICTKEGRLHRIEMESAIGRKLLHWEAVHHIDGNKENYTICNLAVMPAREHQRFHTFLLHRGHPISREMFELVCRMESEYYYRFTKDDHEKARAAFPLIGKSSLVRKPSVCKASGCSGKRAGQGYCSKHYQRWQAIKRGYWKSGGDRNTKCYIKTIA